jgi:hypothetical protein
MILEMKKIDDKLTYKVIGCAMIIYNPKVGLLINSGNKSLLLKEL